MRTKKTITSGRKRESSQEFIQDTEQFIEWLESLDIQVHNASRYQSYLQYFNKTLNPSIPKKVKRKGVTAMHAYRCAELEIYIASRIHRAYKGIETDALVSKLSEIVKGPVLHIHEFTKKGGRNTHSRNILFEIYIGALFIRKGADAIFGDDRFPEPIINIDGYTTAVQCKRLSSYKSIEANIRKAEKQLLKNFDDSEDLNCGIIALNIDKLVNPLGLVLTVTDGNPAHLTGPGSQANAQIRFIVNDIKDIATNLDPKIDGILVNCSYVYTYATDNSSGYFNHLIYIPRNEYFSIFNTLFPRSF